MRRNFQSKSPAPGTPGGSSLMVIFAVLCLTVFAILALSTVLADARIADAYASDTTAYYEADGQAEKIIAALRAGERPEGVEEQDGVYRFTCPVSDEREIQVAVRIEGRDYEVISEKTVYTAPWSSDDSVTVWNGE